MRQESSFRCSNCRAILTTDPLGSKHRNHCPLCLWSKHVDLTTPGDRRSTCCSKMEPMAIAFKNYKINPFTEQRTGELTIIHKCLYCGKLSPNRIAGDDSEYQILLLIKKTLLLDGQILNIIKKLNLEAITTNNKEESLISFLGTNYQTYLDKLNIDI